MDTQAEYNQTTYIPRTYMQQRPPSPPPPPIELSTEPTRLYSNEPIIETVQRTYQPDTDDEYDDDTTNITVQGTHRNDNIPHTSIITPTLDLNEMQVLFSDELKLSNKRTIALINALTPPMENINQICNKQTQYNISNAMNETKPTGTIDLHKHTTASPSFIIYGDKTRVVPYTEIERMNMTRVMCHIKAMHSCREYATNGHFVYRSLTQQLIAFPRYTDTPHFCVTMLMENDHNNEYKFLCNAVYIPTDDTSLKHVNYTTMEYVTNTLRKVAACVVSKETGYTTDLTGVETFYVDDIYNTAVFYVHYEAKPSIIVKIIAISDRLCAESVINQKKTFPSINPNTFNRLQASTIHRQPKPVTPNAPLRDTTRSSSTDKATSQIVRQTNQQKQRGPGRRYMNSKRASARGQRGYES